MKTQDDRHPALGELPGPAGERAGAEGRVRLQAGVLQVPQVTKKFSSYIYKGIANIFLFLVIGKRKNYIF